MNNILIHHGVKGMKWGVRRYQNPDGTLTDAGKKKISKQYDSRMRAANKKLDKRELRIHINAYNKAADIMNNGKIDQFNKAQEKKYGKNYAKRDGYASDYEKMFNKEYDRIRSKSYYEFYTSNKNFQKAQDMVNKYNMLSWDELAKNNNATIQALRKMMK